MPALHREIELRRLQPRQLQVTGESRATESLEPVSQSLPRARQDRHLLGQDGALSGRRLLAELVEKVHPFVANAKQQQRDETRSERSVHDERPKVDLDQAEQRVVDGKEVGPRVPREMARD